jgi:hypothetical protein
MVMIPRCYLPVVCAFISLILASASLSALDFTCLCFQGTYKGLHYSKGENSDQLITINDYSISQKYTYNGPSPLVFYKLSKNEEEETVRTPVAQFPFNQQYKKLLFIFYPNPAQEGTYQVYPIPSDDLAMPPGSYRVQNQTRKQVAMLLDEKTYQFQPGQFQVVTPQAREATSITVEVEEIDNDGAIEEQAKPKETTTLTRSAKVPVHLAYLKEDGQWETFFKRKWRYGKNFRTYVFIYNINGVLQLRPFVEYVN